MNALHKFPDHKMILFLANQKSKIQIDSVYF